MPNTMKPLKMKPHKKCQHMTEVEVILSRRSGLGNFPGGLGAPGVGPDHHAPG